MISPQSYYEMYFLSYSWCLLTMLHFHTEHGNQFLALTQLSVIHANLEMLLADKICKPLTFMIICTLEILVLLLHS